MQKSKLLFLEEKEFITTVYFLDNKKEVYSLKSEINRLANKHLFSINDYRKFVKKQTTLKNKIPIYFSESLLLFYIKDNDCSYWINYFNILKICYDNNIVIIFKNGDILKLEISKKMILKELTKIEIVLDYIQNLYQ